MDYYYDYYLMGLCLRFSKFNPRLYGSKISPQANVTNVENRVRTRSLTARAPIFAGYCSVSHSHLHPGAPYKRSDISQSIAIHSSNHLSLALMCLQITSILGCVRAVRLRQRAFSPVFELSAIPIYTKVCNIKGQISARVQLYIPQSISLQLSYVSR